MLTSQAPMISKFQHFWAGFTQGKTRIYLAWGLLILIPLVSQEELWWPGLVVLAIGTFIRSWASGFIHKDTTLSSAGPYALCRNPLYLGTLLMGLGCAITMKSWIFGVCISLSFIIVYWETIGFEEKKLSAQFTNEFPAYKKSTPRLFPTFGSLIRSLKFSETSQHFAWNRFMQNKGYEPFLSAVGLLILIVITDQFPWKLIP